MNKFDFKLRQKFIFQNFNKREHKPQTDNGKFLILKIIHFKSQPKLQFCLRFFQAPTGPTNLNNPFWPQSFVGQSDWNFIVGTQEIIIYRLVKRNPSYQAYFHILIFGSLLAGKWAWSPCRPQRIWGLLTQLKSWPIGRTFWVNYYLEKLVFKFFMPVPLNWFTLA